MKKLLKILSLFLLTYFFHGFAFGEEVVISADDSVSQKAETNNSDHPSGSAYWFAIHQQAESGVNTLRLLLDTNLSAFEDDLFQNTFVEDDAQRRSAIFLRCYRIINQYSQLTKLIFPFHFFF